MALKTNTFLAIAAILLVMLVSACVETPQQSNQAKNTSIQVNKFKILHIMSYHTPWEWTEDQLNGFKDQLKDVDIEYKIIEMDAKRNSSEEHKQKVSREAMDTIEKWQPDLIYTNDDIAQKYVAKYYVNSTIPVVFGGVNSDPSIYGFVGSTNIAGVTEQEHSVETIRLLKEIMPNITKITIIYDDDPTWTSVVERVKEKVPAQFPDVTITTAGSILTFKEFKEIVMDYQNKTDAFGLLGVHTFKNENNTNVPYQDVLRWVAENSMIPDFSFWKDRVPYGTMVVVSVSGYEQGAAAGRIAHGILVDKKNPASFEMKPTVKGEPFISLARANKLGISIKSGILLTSSAENKFEWDK